MTILEDVEAVKPERPQPSRVKIKMLEQMAEALEDEAVGLYHRAAGFEEKEFLINREIENRQTEINRLLLKLDAMRSERDAVLERIQSITNEATAMREAIYSIEQEFVFQSLEPAQAEEPDAFVASDFRQTDFRPADQPNVSMYFRRSRLAESVR